MSYKLWGLPFMPTIKYPLRAARVSLNLNPFGCWWRPRFVNYKQREAEKREGEVQWSARWLWFEITYSRWL